MGYIGTLTASSSLLYTGVLPVDERVQASVKWKFLFFGVIFLLLKHKMEKETPEYLTGQ